MNLTYNYSTVDDVVSAFQSAVEDEWASMFDQGDILSNALTDEGIAALLPDCPDYAAARASIKAQCADGTDKSIRTIENRIQVSSTFPIGERCDNISWSIHLLCAMQDDPHYWLNYAIDMHITSFRKLKMAIQAGAGDAAKDVERPVYVVDAQPARVFAVTGNRIGLELDAAPNLKQGQAVVVTVMVA